MNRPRLSDRLVPCLLAVALSACAASSRTPVRTIDPSLHVGTMGAQNRFEREMRRPVDTSAPPATKATPVLFWTGATLAVVGAAGTIGFGVAGNLMNNKVENGFDGEFTNEEFDRYQDRGNAFNKATIGSAVVGLVGLSIAAIVYGIDYTRCGPLAPARRQCQQR